MTPILIVSSVHYYYHKVMHWQKLLFQIPSGNSGRVVVSKMCFCAYATGYMVATKAFMAILLLPRLHH